ncbi:MAG: hypothetical protein KF858_12220 [Candidatus Sumerlaeia bacterium]|nr:hypothetical protein [Candidatus Sumerlaeia bacterium]
MTLVELLLALIVSVLIIGSANAVYQTTTRAWDSGRSRSETAQYARAALDLMERYIEAALPADAEAGVVFETASGLIKDTELSADRLTFSTVGGRHLPERAGASDLFEVRFFIELNERLDGEPALMMRRRAFATDDPDYAGTTDELAPRVASFNLTYYDGIEFLDEWEAEELPRAVRVELLLFDFSADEHPVSYSRLIEIRTR